MWKRLRRRSFAPRRPAVYMEEIAPLVITVFALAAGIYVVVRFLL